MRMGPVNNTSEIGWHFSVQSRILCIHSQDSYWVWPKHHEVRVTMTHRLVCLPSSRVFVVLRGFPAPAGWGLRAQKQHNFSGFTVYVPKHVKSTRSDEYVSVIGIIVKAHDSTGRALCARVRLEIFLGAHSVHATYLEKPKLILHTVHE